MLSVVTSFWTWLGFGTKPADASKFKTHNVCDLQSGCISIDMNELEPRMAADRRRPIDVCTVKSSHHFSAVPCWWPFCNCGEK